jgi:hypothetical protein
MFVFAFTSSGLMAKKLLACAFLILFLVGCGAVESNEDSKSQAVSKTNSPQITLSSSQENVALNGSVTLTWDSDYVSSCNASGDWSGNKAVRGSQIINGLTSDKRFGLSCSGVGGTATVEVSVTVNEASVPSVMISASPVNLAYSGSTELSWASSNASSCTASGDWSGDRNSSGSTSISNLLSGKTYSLTCTGPGGSATDSVSVTVAGPSASSVNLTASASSLPFAGSTTLSWNSSNTTDCTASGDWSGSKARSGSQTLTALTSDKVFNLSCSGPGGTANDTVNITVAASAPTLSFSASPASVSQNGSTTLSWNSSNTTNCTASGDWSGSKGTSGSESTGALSIDGQYTLTCSGLSGSVNESVNVTVVQSSDGTALLSWTPPTENTDDSPLTDLAGYKIYYGTSPATYSNTEIINNPGLTSFLIEDLASAEWYFVITSFNSSGIESSYSTEVSKTIQ